MEARKCFSTGVVLCMMVMAAFMVSSGMAYSVNRGLWLKCIPWDTECLKNCKYDCEHNLWKSLGEWTGAWIYNVRRCKRECDGY